MTEKFEKNLKKFDKSVKKFGKILKILGKNNEKCKELQKKWKK